MKVYDKWKDMVVASQRVIEDFNDFADDRATVWADNQIKTLTAERDALKTSLERCENWFESQAKVVSKGCGSPFDLMMLRDERDACTEALKGLK